MTNSHTGDLSHIWSLRKTQGLKREPHRVSALMVSQSWWIMETREKRSRLWTLLKRWCSWMQTSGSSRWRFCSILFLPTASFMFPNKLASWEPWTLRYSGTATPMVARRTDVAAFPVALPSGSGRSGYASPVSTNNLPRTQKTLHINKQTLPNSAADSGHKVWRKDQKLLTAAWSVQMNRDRHLALQRRCINTQLYRLFKIITLLNKIITSSYGH